MIDRLRQKIIRARFNSFDPFFAGVESRDHHDGEAGVQVAGRLTWRDATGALRFVSVVTRDVSDVDAFVECEVPASIPLYRLVHFQIERPARELPTMLRYSPNATWTRIGRPDPADRSATRPSPAAAFRRLLRL